jgi:hypothetical protein
MLPWHGRVRGSIPLGSTASDAASLFYFYIEATSDVAICL